MAEKITWRTEQRKLGELVEWERNPRRLSKHDAEHLAKSIDGFGVADPLIVNTDNHIIGGHMRRRVMLQSGYKPGDLVDVRVPSRALTGREAEELAIRLNKNSGEWDFDLLANGFGVDDLLEWGFTEEELNIEAEPEGEEPKDIPPDRFEEVATKWGTAEGQVWRLGNHKIICGDCLNLGTIKNLLGGEIPNLIIADPPYGVNIVAANVSVGGGEANNIPFGGRKKGYVGGENSIKDKTGHYPIEGWHKKSLTGSVGASKPFGSRAVRGTVGASHIVEVGKYPVIIGDENTDTAREAVTLYRERYSDAVQVWWGANYYVDALDPSQCWLVWNKETTGNFADCELAWTNQDKAARLFTHKWNGMLRDSERERRWHPTQKPAALAGWVFTELSPEDAIILDPFAGAGWSVLGGEQTNRRVRAIEMSKEYIAVILERWSDMTGQSPELVD